MMFDWKWWLFIAGVFALAGFVVYAVVQMVAGWLS